MGCGRDPPVSDDLSIKTDRLSIMRSKDAFTSSHREVQESLRQIVGEINNLEDKINVYFMLKNIVLQSIHVDMKNEELTTEEEETLEGKLDEMKKLDELVNSVKRGKEAFEERLTELLTLIMDTMLEWLRGRLMPDDAGFREMTDKERKNFVKLWRERDGVVEQGRAAFEELTADWNAGKWELDLNMMDCLRGVVSLKDSP